MKVQFGANDNLLEGWINLRSERDGDITKRLNFEDDSVSFIFAEHVVEHVTPHDGYRFFRECFRILKPKGVVRIIVPDIDKVWRNPTDDYRAFIKEGIKTWWPAIGWSVREDHTPNDRELVETLIFCHGHKSVYTADLLETLMATAGFDIEPADYGESRHRELDGIDSHWKYTGRDNCVLESCVIEGTKPA